MKFPLLIIAPVLMFSWQIINLRTFKPWESTVPVQKTGDKRGAPITLTPQKTPIGVHLTGKSHSHVIEEGQSHQTDTEPKHQKKV